MGGKAEYYSYDADRQRTTREHSDGGKTLYIHPRADLGGHYEKKITARGVIKHKSHLYAGRTLIAVHTRDQTEGTTKLRYLHPDHLGSVDAVTDESGALVEQLSYNAWGKRRDSDWTAATTAILPLTTHHGFTGHEHLDELGLIHMNGRIYDPSLGRFLSADPHVQAPLNPQSLNRYSYVRNNPLTYTDPSGYFSLKKDFLDDILGLDGHTNAVFAIALGALTGGAAFGVLNGLFIPGGALTAGIVGGAVGGFTAGYIGSGGDLSAAWGGALAGAIFGGIGAHANLSMGLGGTGPWAEGGINRVLAHAVGGGVTSVLQGGKFQSGFLSAGFAQFAAPGIGRIPGQGLPAVTARTVAAAVVGGTASSLGGGKFENGARTAAFSYLFSSAGSSVAQNGVAGSLAGLGRGVLDVVGKVWALPNTIVGFTAGMAGVPFGGDWPSLGNNAIQFENNPLASGGAITFGNAIVYGGSRYDLAADGNQFWRHEMQHTYQAQILGPLYLPSNILGGTVSAVTGGGWHGPLNWNEIGPQQHPPQPW